MRRGVVIAIVIGVVVLGGAGLGITLLVTSLGKHEPLAADQMPLVGKWVDVTGDTLIIKADGEGDYTSPSVNISGGDAHIDGDHLVIGFSMIKKQFTITQRPTAASPTLVLDGVAFTRSGGGAAEPAGVAGLTPEQGAQANAAMLAALYKAVEADDANILSAQFAAAAQGQLTGPVLRDHFSPFFQKPMLPLLKQAMDGLPKTATVTALTGKEDGNYSAKNVVTLPNGQVFTIFCKYVNENGAYKAYSINADLPRLAQAAPAAGAVAGLTPEQGAQANAAMLAALYKAVEADDANILSAQFAAAVHGQLTGPVLREHFAGFFQKPMLPVLKQAMDGVPKTATVVALTGSGDDGNYSAKNVVALPSGQTFTIFCKYVNENGSYKAYSIDASLSRLAQATPAEPKADAPADADETPVKVKKVAAPADADDDDAPAKVKRADPLTSAGDRLTH